MSTTSIETAHQTLQQTWGLDFGRIRRLVGHLAAWQTHDELVDASALSHRGIGQVLRLLEPWLERDGERLRITPAHLDVFRSVFASPPLPPDPHAETIRTHPAWATLENALAQRPRPDRHLDHVAATCETLLKRGLFVAETYDVTQAQVLCLGDHDLTSFALACTCPGLSLAVVDVDQRLLAHIDAVAREHGWNIETYFADLRLELPRSLQGRFDLVFTDPPYNPIGIKLFLQRGITALKDHPFARLLLAYGFGEQHPGLGYKAQSTIHELRLVLEAVLPQFNRYQGARAIGAQSALYALRPTRRSRPAAERVAITANIYTHGRSAEEAETKAPLADALIIVNNWEKKETIVVGDSWPKETFTGTKRLSLTDYLQACRSGNPPRVHHQAIQLNPHFDSYLLHLLLTTQAESLLVTTHPRQCHILKETDPLYPLVACKYHLIERSSTSNATWLLLEKTPTPRDDALHYTLRYIADHPTARLANAWREALIAWRKSQGTTLTKNQARELIGQGPVGSTNGNHYLTELPQHLLAKSVQEIEQTIKE